MAKAKFDIKAAMINHVEKGIFALVLLIVLGSLAGARWSPYPGTPGEINQKVATSENNLKSHTWPEDEKEKFPLVKPDSLVDRALYASIDPRPLESSIELVIDPLSSDEPVREPTLKSLESLIATSSRVFLQIADDLGAEETDAKSPEEEKKDENDDLLDELRVRDRGRMAQAGGALGGYGASYGGYEEYAVELTDSAYMAGGSGYGGVGYGGPGAGEAGYGGGMAQQRPRLNGQGFHFVSVRAVFPLRDQISKFADATNQSYSQAAANFDIIDFELQRQVGQKGSNQWPENEESWEPVDINVVKDILDQSAGFEPDVVSSVVTNSVITMPLPMRISGEWRNQATHDRIKNFVLTPEQVQMEMDLNRAMLQQAVESKKEMRQTTIRRGGFSDLQFDSRELQGALMGSENIYAMGGYDGGEGYGGGGAGGMMRGGAATTARNRRTQQAQASNNPFDQLISKLAEGSEKPEDREKAIRDWIKERASVDGELLLFRYLDFSVEPGKTYRYRARLILRNPNFGKRIADAGGLAHVVAGETRTTEWSNITDPVTVQEDTYYFLTRVNEPRGANRLLPSAQLDVFHWDSKYGTMVNKAFEVRMGQPVADQVKAEVIDAAGQKVEKDFDYAFNSGNFLVDAVEDLTIDRNFHSNDRMDPKLRLDLLRGFRDRFRTQAQVLMKDDRDDELVHRDQTKLKDRYASLQTYMKSQAEITYKHLYETKTSLMDAAGYDQYSELYAEGGGYGGGEMYEMYNSGNRGRNSLRKGGRSARGARGGEGGGGMMVPAGGRY